MNEQYEMGPAYKKKMKWGFLLTETYRIYSQRFWTLFRIGLPIAVAAYFVSRGTRFLINQFIVH